ncbi:hypothetical protein E2562_022282 [Oryza meyeriana var. granulata]|uniref:Uncharacterized protein n=1 Tax=Oryza meyeriana var. granulata TaxID=110450 RepID=A0A6G1D555_9ORYZ|nr:hypothetical protein E2562_022282 [Oryza meyeriana var. granulata]
MEDGLVDDDLPGRSWITPRAAGDGRRPSAEKQCVMRTAQGKYTETRIGSIVGDSRSAARPNLAAPAERNGGATRWKWAEIGREQRRCVVVMDDGGSVTAAAVVRGCRTAVSVSGHWVREERGGASAWVRDEGNEGCDGDQGDLKRWIKGR